MLGPLEVLDGERRVALGGPRQRAILAVLLSEANRVVAVDRLIDLLWGGEPPEQATATLQTYVSNLRRALEPDRPPRARPTVLVTRAPGYSIQVAPGDLDAAELEELATAGRDALANDPARTRNLLSEALALWRGVPYADFGDEPWVLAERNRLEELRLGCLEDRFEAALALGDHASVATELGPVVDAHPLRERARGQLMLALYRSGRQVDALRRYEEGRRLLAEELGLEPGPDLRRLEAAILAHEVDVPAPRVAAPVTSRRAASGSWHPPLVGRTRELEAVDAVLAGTSEGRGAILVVEGEPGTGKTSLLGEIADRAARAGHLVLVGRSVDADSAPPLAPWPELVRVALDAVPDPRILGEATAEDLRCWSSSATPPGAAGLASPEVTRGRIFDAVARLLDHLAGDRPVTVVVDDLHRGGDDALALLTVVSSVVERAPVVLATAVSSLAADRRAALSNTLAALARSPAAARLPLGPFGPEDVAACLAAVAGREPDAALLQTVGERTGGNPFLTVEIARLLATGHDEPDAVPANVRDAIEARVSRLPETTRTLLEVASVLGRRFELPVVARASALDASEAAAALEPAEATGLIEEDGDFGVFRFAHGLVRDVVAGGLGALQTARLHDALATTLGERHGSQPSRWVELASHAVRALPVGDPHRAVAWLARAARHATSSLALDQAEHLHRQRLAVVEQSLTGEAAAREELAARTELAVLLTWRTGQAAAAVGNELARALDLARVLDDPVAEARAQWGLWSHLSVRGEHELASARADQLHELARRLDDPFLATIADVATGATAWQRGDHRAAREALDRARPGLDLVGDVELAQAMLAHPKIHWRVFDALVRWFEGDGTGGLAAARGAVEEARALAHPFTEQSARSFALVLTAIADDPRSAEPQARALLASADDLGFTYFSTMASAVLGWARARDGDPEGIAELRRALAARQQLEVAVGAPALLGLLADALLTAGSPAGALEVVDEALAAVERQGERYWEAELQRVRGRALAALGRPEEAEAARLQALAIATAQGATGLVERAMHD